MISFFLHPEVSNLGPWVIQITEYRKLPHWLPLLHDFGIFAAYFGDRFRNFLIAGCNNWNRAVL